MSELLPPFVDHHVHLQLIDVAALAAGGLAGVVDLGGNPDVLASVSEQARQTPPYVRFAGAFLTAPGGYPSDRPWAPPGSVRELRSPVDAAEAVAEQFEHGAAAVKVTLNAEAGPVLTPALLDAVVAAAHARRLPVVAHAEGAGMARQAVDAGADVLAHTPWTERLDRDLVAAAADQGQRWITTLDIHHASPADWETAVNNLAQFHGAGGRVLYGTDLGNGELPLGVNARELSAMVRAGLDHDALIAALTDPWPAQIHPDGLATRIDAPDPAEPGDLPGWLAQAQVARRS